MPPRLQTDIGLYRENVIGIESEAKYPFGGNVYYVTMQITLPIPEFTRNERNFHCDVLHITTKWVFSPDSFWMTRSQRSRRRDNGLWNTIITQASAQHHLGYRVEAFATKRTKLVN